ncbi:hypothetical protein RUM43_012049 [Polyplax serrata]|uniref:Uncharacterized protein n=1 Tax=Polyplax serrata TaxID=468196 RepID=A0AAN8S9T5_POLSC
MSFMGCSGSRLSGDNCEDGSEQPEGKQASIVNSKLEKLLRSKRPDDLLIAFIYLEKGISDEEKESPSSIYGEALSRQQQIQVNMQLACGDKDSNEFFSEECSIYDLFVDLGIKSPKTAAEHEEFVARINRRALNRNAIKIWQKMFRDVEDQINRSSRRIKILQSAYQQQEELLGRIFGKAYESETEKILEKELDRMRYYRDMLYIGVLQWEACLKRIEMATYLAKEGVSSWRLIRNQSLEKMLKLTTMARDCLQEAIILIQSSEELLSDVQFPYCTTRELRGVMQALDYVFTDIFIEERYLHATEVYRNLLQRSILLDGWMKERSSVRHS